MPVGTGRILTFARAVSALGLTDRDTLYWAGRTTMIARRDDLEAYDEVFDDWYRSLRSTDDLRVELNLPTPRPRATTGSTGDSSPTISRCGSPRRGVARRR